MPGIFVPRSLRRAYARLAGDGSGAPFPERALAALEISLRIDGAGLAGIPAAGPLIVVANHPFGAADGLAVLAMLERVRPDVRVVGNAWLAKVPELAGRCVRVDPDARRHSVGANASALRETLRWLRGGGCLVIFPAGEVAHRLAGPGVAVDSAWRMTPVVLAGRSSATILPVFVRGANSRVFRLAGRLHPALRTILLAAELARLRGACIRLAIGAAIPHAELSRIEGVGARLSYVRARTFLLANDPAGDPPAAAPAASAPADIAPAGPSEAVAAEVAALAPERLLLESGDLRVFCASAIEMPAALHEIGRLREIAFRAAGEGSGLPRDLDHFDLYYRHLFVWNARDERIVGAYRVGATDEILARIGPNGLYTRTLFQYDERLLDRLGPALELGRAFVRIECQRDFSPLVLL
ncbi:MAG: lysophospholipid acyltransferase family protein, partial [Vicinamibacterales bacterium]